MMRCFNIGVFIFYILFWCGCSTDNPIENDDESKADGPERVEEDPLAFPSAEGFGKDATGGRGGKVIFVTNLNDGGPGSFRWAVESTSGPRYVIFKVSGNIELNSKLVISQGDITIAGQTAPGDGISINQYPVIINADNVIIRYLRFRPGDEAGMEADALEGRFKKNIIIDHCSMSWCTDEAVSLYGNENTTVQWCLIYESLVNSAHDKGAHGYGGLWGGKRASFHHNLLAHHDSRNPRLREVEGDPFALTDLVDLRNNVIYNWGNNSCYGGEAMNVNIVNCYYKPGPATPSSKRERIIAIDKEINTSTHATYDIWGKFFIDGNIIDGSIRASDDNWTYGVLNQFHGKYGTITDEDIAHIKINSAHDIQNNVKTHSAEEAYEKVLEWAGASKARDEADLRVVSEVRSGQYTYEGSNGSTNGHIDSHTDVGGWPLLQSFDAPLDTDGDGIPDEWERLYKLDPDAPDAIGHNLSSAYDNIEVYINSLVKDISDGQY
ncbi:pectate lyase [Persicobacter diffluens]|uniref:Pectate lyase n=1 Tax=Persicobacter diffluens TaxID=981 RepID=A0AAN4W2N8_9BACT|nr:pectate lyase [Persicobacter diffluens]